MPEQPARSGLAASFDRSADTYERARPNNPDAAVGWPLASGPSVLLDNHPAPAGRDSWELPYRTEAFRITVG